MAQMENKRRRFRHSRTALARQLTIASLKLVPVFGLLALVLGCAETLPDDVANYRQDCTKMNPEPLPKRSDDPHEGVKDVYACNVPDDALIANERPFPDGTVIIKESTRSDSSYPWLVATARKRSGSWQWDEYTRNFADEEFLHIISDESVCTDCHDAARGLDWIFTFYNAP